MTEKILFSHACRSTCKLKLLRLRLLLCHHSGMRNIFNCFSRKQVREENWSPSQREKGRRRCFLFYLLVSQSPRVRRDTKKFVIIQLAASFQSTIDLTHSYCICYSFGCFFAQLSLGVDCPCEVALRVKFTNFKDHLRVLVSQ